MTTIKTNKNTFRPGEFKARLPRLEDIPTDNLKYRFSKGVGATLALASAVANSIGRLAYVSGDAARLSYKADARAVIASCNYSASQVAKELKLRGERM